MQLFGKEYPFSLADWETFLVYQDGRGNTTRAVLEFQNNLPSYVITDTQEIEAFKDLCHFGNIPISVNVPARGKVPTGIPTGMKFGEKCSMPGFTMDDVLKGQAALHKAGMKLGEPGAGIELKENITAATYAMSGKNPEAGCTLHGVTPNEDLEAGVTISE